MLKQKAKATDVTIEAVRERILRRMPDMEKLLAIGVFGSLVRGEFTSHSDIDIFVVLADDAEPAEEEAWWHRVRTALADLRRDITVLVYTPRALKNICDWHVFRLASENVFFHDAGQIATLFRKILRAARKAGIRKTKLGKRAYWSFQNPSLERSIEVRVE